MTRDQAIELMKQGKKVTHTYFMEGEFVTMKGDKIISEEGYEINPKEFWHYRGDPAFDNGWEEFIEPTIDPRLFVAENEKEMKRLYDWLMDEKRRKAGSFFTAGWTRNVAKEIEFRLAGATPPPINAGVEERALEYATGMMGLGEYDEKKWHYGDKTLFNTIVRAVKFGSGIAGAQSSIPSSLVDQLRKENPYKEDVDGQCIHAFRNGYNQCCDKLQSLLNDKRGGEDDQDELLLDISRYASNNKYKSPTLKGETASFVADIPKIIEYIKSKYHITKK